MLYTKEEIITAAEQEIEAWKSKGDKPRTDNDYMYLGFLRAVVNRLPSVSQNSGKPLVSGSLPLSEAQITELAHIGSNYVYEGVMEDGRISELGILEVIKKYEEFKRQ